MLGYLVSHHFVDMDDTAECAGRPTLERMGLLLARAGQEFLRASWPFGRKHFLQ
jgi:hypothetical protein